MQKTRTKLKSRAATVPYAPANNPAGVESPQASAPAQPGRDASGTLRQPIMLIPDLNEPVNPDTIAGWHFRAWDFSAQVIATLGLTGHLRSPSERGVNAADGVELFAGDDAEPSRVTFRIRNLRTILADGHLAVVPDTQEFTLQIPHPRKRRCYPVYLIQSDRRSRASSQRGVAATYEAFRLRLTLSTSHGRARGMEIGRLFIGGGQSPRLSRKHVAPCVNLGSSQRLWQRVSRLVGALDATIQLCRIRTLSPGAAQSLPPQTVQVVDSLVYAWRAARATIFLPQSTPGSFFAGVGSLLADAAADLTVTANSDRDEIAAIAAAAALIGRDAPLDRRLDRAAKGIRLLSEVLGRRLDLAPSGGDLIPLKSVRFASEGDRFDRVTCEFPAQLRRWVSGGGTVRICFTASAQLDSTSPADVRISVSDKTPGFRLDIRSRLSQTSAMPAIAGSGNTSTTFGGDHYYGFNIQPSLAERSSARLTFFVSRGLVALDGNGRPLGLRVTAVR